MLKNKTSFCRFSTGNSLLVTCNLVLGFRRRLLFITPNLLLITCYLILVSSSLFALDWDSIDYQKAAAGTSKLIKASTNLNEDQEVELGKEVAGQLISRYGFLKNEKKLRYLAMVGQTVSRRSTRPELPYHFGILKTSEINAWATPGGYIFVTEGLLSFLKNESELAGVLAHEISHVTQKHILKAMKKANFVEAGSNLAEATGKDLSAYTSFSDFSMKLLENGLSRDDELEADRVGTTFLAKTGYDINGLRHTVERLENQSTTSALAHFSQTHPLPKERLEVIDKAIQKQKMKTQGVQLQERYQLYFNNPPKTKA